MPSARHDELESPGHPAAGRYNAGAALYLETKWAALMSYGLTVKLLQDVLPIDEPLAAVTIRNHVLTVAQRLEDALGDEQWSFIDSCPAEWSRWMRLLDSPALTKCKTRPAIYQGRPSRAGGGEQGRRSPRSQ
jgi:hypothetical protein